MHNLQSKLNVNFYFARLLHDDANIHATLARLYNLLENWREMKTVFGRTILTRTDDLLILSDISICYD